MKLFKEKMIIIYQIFNNILDFIKYIIFIKIDFMHLKLNF